MERGQAHRSAAPGTGRRLTLALATLATLATLACACSSSSSGSATTPADAGGSSYPATDSNAMCQATITQGGLGGKVSGATCEYLGVPYGAPPTGPLRFMPPKAAPGWTGPRSATAFGPSCLQGSTALGAVGATSEDCLSLNVFTPRAAPDRLLPVMVFVYGGAFTSGSSSLYDGQPLSEAGPVVVVTVNYRLGALGFLALPELDAARPGTPSGSDGIRDQQLALKWVKDNIATFHGDASNVTVFGESAGSASTCIHLVSPDSQGLAKRYIMESGACVGRAMQLSTQAQAYATGAQLAASFCPGGDAGASEAGGSDLLACLRAADPAQVVTWVPPPGTPQTGIHALVGNLLGPPFGPTIEGAGGVLPDTPDNLIASGAFNKSADVLAGTNKNEWGLFPYIATSPLLGGSSSSSLNVTTSAQLNQGIEMVFGVAKGAEVEAQYPSTDATAPQVFVDIVTDYAFRCPTRELARVAMAHGVKNYYLYSYDIGPAWHSFELVPLFNVSALRLLGATTPSAGYTREMLGFWTRFAATGSPNVAADAGSPTWPSYASASDQYLQLVDPTPAPISHLSQAHCDFWATFQM